jgi:proton-translocating NADH-quinone oxidoreductase chain N
VPSLLILLPCMSIVILNLLGPNLMRKVSFKLSALVALFQIAVTAFHPAKFWNLAGDPFAKFLALNFSMDKLTLVALLSVGIVIFVTLWVAKAMLPGDTQKFNFVNLIMLAFLGMNISVMATDLFSIYVFIEATALASFILIALNKDKLAIEGAFKYLILSSFASVMMLSAVGLFLLFSGGTSFGNISAALAHSGNAFLLKVALGLFLCGLFIKSGLVPFHGWLPDAYSSASAPVSVLLAGIVTKISGVYVLLRLTVSVFSGMELAQNLLMFFGVISIVVGALLALTQKNFKRLLSYSSISQVGYIVLAAGCGTPLAIIGAVFHFFNHAVFKSLLFVNAAAVEKQTGSQEMENMKGLAEKMPVTAWTSVIGFLSTAGIPPLSGFWSKLIIVIALWHANHFLYASVAIMASVITLGYLLYFQRQVFAGKSEINLGGIKEVGFPLLFPQVFLATIIVLVGVLAPWVLQWR